MMNIKLPKPTTYQSQVIDFLTAEPMYSSGKTACVKSVRQSGKSFMSMLVLFMFALTKKCRSVYIAPTLQQATMTFKAIVNALKDTPLLSATNGSTFAIEFTNGSDILFRSTAQGTSLRGLTVTGILILDEAAFLKDEDINTVLPFCNAHNAPILAISTPFARSGYFYDLYTMGIQNANQKLKAWDWAKHPEISRFLTEERKDFYRRTMTRQMYNTEILGQFLADDGLLFTNISANICDDSSKPDMSHLYIGIDFGTGTTNDFTVVSVFNDEHVQVAVHATNTLTPMQQVDWIAEILNGYAKKGTIMRILAEVNSIGHVYIDSLRRKLDKNIKITPWTTSNKSKKDLVSTFQLALEQNDVKIVNDHELITELGAYEMQVSKSGTVTYNGRTGVHDDYVMATMLSFYALKSMTRSTYRISLV